MRVQIIDNFDAIGDMIDRAEKVALLKIASRVRDAARDLMPFASGSAKSGEPPHSHFGDLRRSIGVGLNIDTDEVVVGPRESMIGLRGNVLEFAGTFTEGGRGPGGRFAKGRQSRKAPSGARWAHPFMKPALEQVQETFAGTLAGSFE